MITTTSFVAMRSVRGCCGGRRRRCRLTGGGGGAIVRLLSCWTVIMHAMICCSALVLIERRGSAFAAGNPRRPNHQATTPDVRPPWSVTTTPSSLSSSAPARGRRRGRRPLLLGATTSSDDADGDAVAVDMSDVGFVLLAGGKGSRMKASMPKQFLELRGVPILHHSLHLFLERLSSFLEAAKGKLSGPPAVVLVLDPMYQPDYQAIVDRYPGRLYFANPGKERQGSVENGLSKLVEVCGGHGGGGVDYVAIHDSARPLVTVEEICDVVRDAKEMGAAVLGVPCKATIKESADGGKTVLRTIPRARLWEVHTPQVIRIDTLLRGFAKVAAENLEVTDDVSIVEAMGEPVKLTHGRYTNLKITTPEDMDVATAILEERQSEPIDMLAITGSPAASTIP